MSTLRRTVLLAAQGCPQCQLPPRHLLAIARRSYTTNSNSTGPSPKEAASSRTAAEQRRILDSLRSSSSSSSSAPRTSSITGKPSRTQASDLREVAAAALKANSTGAGPISLGMMGDTSARMPRRMTRFERWSGEGKEWKTLSAGQKVIRSSVFSSRLIFISGGFVFVLVLTYALATELLARNSPTVVYGEACSLVSSSAEVRKHLLPPFKFHTSFSTTLGAHSNGDGGGPLLPSRGRRSRTVTAAITNDAQTGEELMLVRFFVGARDKDHDLTLWDRARQSIVDGAAWTKDRAMNAWDDVRDAWDEATAGGQHEAARHHSSGSRQDRLSDTAAVLEAQHGDQGQGLVAGALSGLLGSFVGLTRGAGEAVRAGAVRASEPGTWSSGEVHGELHKDENGIFQFERLFVDIPSSRAISRNRVWIVRKAGDVTR